MRQLLFFFLIALSLNAKAQYSETFSFCNKSYSIGFLGGAVTFPSDNYVMLGFNTTIYGVYFDFGGFPRLNGEATSNTGVHDDKYSLSTHIGYQIPITKWLRIIPMIGYSMKSEGYSDTGHGSLHPGGMTTDYYETGSSNGFDYGGQLVIGIKHLNIFGTYNKHSIYGGIGYQF